MSAGMSKAVWYGGAMYLSSLPLTLNDLNLLGPTKSRPGKDIQRLEEVQSMRVWPEKHARALMGSMSHMSVEEGGRGKAV